MCDVNDTRMFNDNILWRFIEASILSRKETTFYREPFLLILDAYGCHMKLVDSKRLNAYNIFPVIVLDHLTGIIQPLDVGVNRSFQQSYAKKYDAYIA